MVLSVQRDTVQILDQEGEKRRISIEEIDSKMESTKRNYAKNNSDQVFKVDSYLRVRDGIH